MSRKLLFNISIVLIVALALGLLGACSTPAPVTTTATATATATTTVATTITATATATTVIKPITLVFTEFEPKNSFWDKEFAQPWFAELDKRTGGRIKVEAHWGGEIAGLFEAYDTIVKGTADMGKILPTMNAEKFPWDGATLFGYVNQVNYRPSQMWYDLYQQFPEWQQEYANTPMLALTTMPCAGLMTTKNRVVTKLEDAKGLKFPGAGPAAESRLKAAGIVPASLQPSETYMAFKTGTLDGLVAALRSVEDFGWGDVLTNGSLINLNGSPWCYVMNKKTWDSLPADIQKTMKDMIPWLIELNDKVQAKVHKESMASLNAKYGIKITELSKAELDRWAAVDNPTLDAYIAQYVTAKGLPGAKLKSEFDRLWTKYSAPEYQYK